MAPLTSSGSSDGGEENDVYGSDEGDGAVPDDEVGDPAAPAPAPSRWVPIPERPKIPPPRRDHGPAQPCSRAKSREARRIVEERLVAKARTFDVQIDPRCKLHPRSDLLRAHEANKSALSSAQWKCETCGKLFRTEGYLDLHMDRKHMGTLPADASVCLADFCDILGCASSGPAAGVACSAPHMQRRRILCQHLMHNCFPPELNAEYWHAHELFEHELCDRLTCDPSSAGAPFGQGGAHALRIVGSVVVGIVLIIVAIGVWCHQLDARTEPDLRRRRGRATAKVGRGGFSALLGRVGLAKRPHSD